MEAPYKNKDFNLIHPINPPALAGGSSQGGNNLMPIAGKNSIHILRGANVKTNSSIATLTLSEGQPLYDTQTGYLYVGEGNTIANTVAIRAHYANTAGSATSATSASYAGCFASKRLYFNGTYANGVGYNTGFRGNVIDTIYVPTALGSTGQVWGMTSSGRAGWIDQTEIPGTIEHANTADVAYEVSGSNVSGSVANANFAKTAGKVTHSFKLNVNGTSYTYNGGNVDIDVLNDNPVVTLSKTTAKGAIVYTNATGRIKWLSHPGVSGRVLTSGSGGSIYWSTPATKTVYVMEDINAGTIAYEPDSQGIPSATNIKGVINQLYSYGHSSSSSALNAVGAYGGKSVTGIYASSNSSLSIKCSDSSTLSRGSTFPITIHKL